MYKKKKVRDDNMFTKPRIYSNLQIANIKTFETFQDINKM